MIAIIGAGIGGLSTALALHQRGIECQVYESTEVIRALGVGINLLPHACKTLTGLDLIEPLRDIAIETRELHYYNKFGQQIWHEPRGLAAGYEWPQFSIHRGELQALLLATVLERCGPNAVTTGMSATSVTSGPTQAEVSFRSGDGEETRVLADAVIAADGIRSAVRAERYPDEGMPLWNGALMWRGIVETEPFLDGETMFMAGHETQKFVAYPISATRLREGRSLTNWIAELRFPSTDLAEREDWSRPGDFADFESRFANWRFDWLDIPELLERAPTCYEFPMVDRDPVSAWCFGVVTLLGDAAHPMYPIGSNGASQAMLDAASIATHFAATDEVAAAFKAYEAERLPPTASIVRANRGNGPEQVMQLAEERAPDGFDDIEQVLPLIERQAIADSYKQVAGFAKDRLNATGSTDGR